MGVAKKKRAHRLFWKETRMNRKDWEEMLRGRMDVGWGVGGYGCRNYGSFQYACLANIICIERLWMEFCVTVICIHLHKINPFPIATEIVSDAETKSTK